MSLARPPIFRAAACHYTDRVMEIDGHPTQDLIEELQSRGATRLDGTTAGPRSDSLRFLSEKLGDAPGWWLFLPHEAFETDLDEPPI